MTALTDMIDQMKELADEINERDQVVKELRGRYDKLRLFDIPNQMAEEEITSIKGYFGRCTLTSDLHVSVKNKQGLHDYLNESGNESLIVPTVNAQTLKAFVKEQLVAGELLPEDLIKVSPFSRAVLYKN